MSATRSPRWLMSFADLCLLLLGFFVLLHARADGTATAASVRTAFGGSAGKTGTSLDLAAVDLFEADDAVLRPAQARRITVFGQMLARRHGRVRIASRGSDAGTARLDSWELSAARAAAVARALAAGGLSPEQIDIAMPQRRDPAAGAQRLTIGPA